MVGKPNLPPDADKRPHLKGAARATPGLTALDEEREASMADEGGSSGAFMEGEETGAIEGEEEEDDDLELEEGYWLPEAMVLGGVFLLGTLAGIFLARLWDRD